MKISTQRRLSDVEICLVFMLNVVKVHSSLPRECRTGLNFDFDYNGTMSVTVRGIACQMWSSQTPHAHSKHPWEHNYCRNPKVYEHRPWCYTVNPNIKWEYCEVPLCDGVTIECLKDKTGSAYGGHMNVTGSGKTCQKWSKQSPHQHSYIAMGDMNYCRTTRDAIKPFCYTTDPTVRFEYCDIPFCDLEVKECLIHQPGYFYRGYRNVTESGKQCQSWTSQSPNSHEYNGINGRNYCRNPDVKETKPWCYTTITGWEHCDIPLCEAVECRRTIAGTYYSGTKNETESGAPCQWWSSQTPHSHLYEYLASERNYCRNTDNSKRPWCYTTTSVRYDFCDIPICVLQSNTSANSTGINNMTIIATGNTTDASISNITSTPSKIATKYSTISSTTFKITHATTNAIQNSAPTTILLSETMQTELDTPTSTKVYSATSPMIDTPSPPTSTSTTTIEDTATSTDTGTITTNMLKCQLISPMKCARKCHAEGNGCSSFQFENHVYVLESSSAHGSYNYKIQV